MGGDVECGKGIRRGGGQADAAGELWHTERLDGLVLRRDGIFALCGTARR